MFFATKSWVARAFQRDNIQVWKTKKEIRLLFLVESLENRSWVKSNLPQLYKQLFPLEKQENIDDLDIKHFDHERRDKLVNKLFQEHKISGWLSSLEDRIEIEVCLFNSENIASLIEHVDTTNGDNESYFKDSLEGIHVNPPQSFFTTTEGILEKKAPCRNKGENQFLRYQRWMEGVIQDEMKQYNLSEENVRHYYYNLRMKLEI